MILREYCHTAQVRHWCDCCHWDIMPGERYEGTVIALGQGRLMVSKRHIDPCCDPEPDPEEDEERELEETQHFTRRAA